MWGFEPSAGEPKGNGGVKRTLENRTCLIPDLSMTTHLSFEHGIP